MLGTGGCRDVRVEGSERAVDQRRSARTLDHTCESVDPFLGREAEVAGHGDLGFQGHLQAMPGRELVDRSIEQGDRVRRPPRETQRHAELKGDGSPFVRARRELAGELEGIDRSVEATLPRASTAELRTDDRTLLGRRRLGHGTLQQGCRRRRSAVGHGRCGRVPQPINHPRVPVALGEQQMSGHSFVVTVLVEDPRGAKVRKPAIRLGDVRVHGGADQWVDEVQSSVRVQNPFAAKSRDGACDRLGFHAGKLGDAAKLGVDAENGDRAADACRFWSEPVHPHEQRSGEGLRSDVAEPTGLVSRRLDSLVLERRQCFHEEERVSAGRPRACFGELGREAR